MMLLEWLRKPLSLKSKNFMESINPVHKGVKVDLGQFIRRGGGVQVVNMGEGNIRNFLCPPLGSSKLFSSLKQGATKVLSDSPGLVELSVGLAYSDHGLPDGQATHGQETLFFFMTTSRNKCASDKLD